MYLTHKLEKVGITPGKIPDVISQALKIDTVEALETALGCCLTGISWAMDQAAHPATHARTEDKKQVFKMFLSLPDVKKASQRLKELKAKQP